MTSAWEKLIAGVQDDIQKRFSSKLVGDALLSSCLYLLDREVLQRISLIRRASRKCGWIQCATDRSGSIPNETFCSAECKNRALRLSTQVAALGPVRDRPNLIQHLSKIYPASPVAALDAMREIYRRTVPPAPPLPVAPVVPDPNRGSTAPPPPPPTTGGILKAPQAKLAAAAAATAAASSTAAAAAAAAEPGSATAPLPSRAASTGASAPSSSDTATAPRPPATAAPRRFKPNTSSAATSRVAPSAHSGASASKAPAHAVPPPVHVPAAGEVTIIDIPYDGPMAPAAASTAAPAPRPKAKSKTKGVSFARAGAVGAAGAPPSGSPTGAAAGVVAAPVSILKKRAKDNAAPAAVPAAAVPAASAPPATPPPGSVIKGGIKLRPAVLPRPMGLRGSDVPKAKATAAGDAVAAPVTVGGGMDGMSYRSMLHREFVGTLPVATYGAGGAATAAAQEIEDVWENGDDDDDDDDDGDEARDGADGGLGVICLGEVPEGGWGAVMRGGDDDDDGDEFEDLIADVYPNGAADEGGSAAAAAAAVADGAASRGPQGGRALGSNCAVTAALAAADDDQDLPTVDTDIDGTRGVVTADANGRDGAYVGDSSDGTAARGAADAPSDARTAADCGADGGSDGADGDTWAVVDSAGNVVVTAVTPTGAVAAPPPLPPPSAAAAASLPLPHMAATAPAQVPAADASSAPTSSPATAPAQPAAAPRRTIDSFIRGAVARARDDMASRTVTVPVPPPATAAAAGWRPRTAPARGGGAGPAIHRTGDDDDGADEYGGGPLGGAYCAGYDGGYDSRFACGGSAGRGSSSGEGGSDAEELSRPPKMQGAKADFSDDSDGDQAGLAETGFDDRDDGPTSFAAFYTRVDVEDDLAAALEWTWAGWTSPQAARVARGAAEAHVCESGVWWGREPPLVSSSAADSAAPDGKARKSARPTASSQAPGAAVATSATRTAATCQRAAHAIGTAAAAAAIVTRLAKQTGIPVRTLAHAVASAGIGEVGGRVWEGTRAVLRRVGGAKAQPPRGWEASVCACVRCATSAASSAVSFASYAFVDRFPFAELALALGSMWGAHILRDAPHASGAEADGSAGGEDRGAATAADGVTASGADDVTAPHGSALCDPLDPAGVPLPAALPHPPSLQVMMDGLGGPAARAAAVSLLGGGALLAAAARRRMERAAEGGAPREEGFEHVAALEEAVVDVAESLEHEWRDGSTRVCGVCVVCGTAVRDGEGHEDGDRIGPSKATTADGVTEPEGVAAIATIATQMLASELEG